MKRILAAGFALVFIWISSSALAAPGQNGTPGNESLNLPDELITRVNAVLSMNGAAGEEQFLARVNAFDDYLHAHMGEFQRDPVGVINAAIVDPAILATGTGNVLVSAGSGGGGGRNDPCGGYIESLISCRQQCQRNLLLSPAEQLACQRGCSQTYWPQYLQCMAHNPVCGAFFDWSYMKCCPAVNPQGGQPCPSVCSETVRIPFSISSQIPKGYYFQFRNMSDTGNGASLSVFVRATKQTIVVAPCGNWPWGRHDYFFPEGTVNGNDPLTIDVSVDMNCRNIPNYKDTIWHFILDCDAPPTKP